MVFIQGTGVHGEAWLSQLDGLANRYRCLIFDNRGMGRSQPAGGRLTIEQMVEDVCVLMDAEGWKSAHVVGHSLGGLVALGLTLAASQRVRSLTLLCTFSKGADAARLSWETFWLGLRTYLGTRRMRRLAFLQMVMPPQVLAALDREALAERLGVVFGHDLADHPSIVMKQLAAMRGYDATPHLGSIKGVPVLVGVAKHDRIARRAVGKALADRIPGARFVEFPDAAHGVCIQCAEEVNALLHEHFSNGEERK